MSDQDKKVIRAERRRKGKKPSDGRERANAPERQRDQGAKQPTTGYERPSSSRPRPVSGQPTLRAGKLGCVPILVIAGVLILFFVFGGSQVLSPDPSMESAPIYDLPADDPGGDFESFQSPDPTRIPDFTPPPRSAEGRTWLVLLYMDADDKMLEQDIFLDLNEAERIGSNDQVHIVAQIDRFRGGFSGDGDWASTKRFYITLDENLRTIASKEIADLGEINMGDGNSLVDFATWGINTFPADKHVLILSDHGLGWPGGWSDPAPAAQPESGSPLEIRLGNHLYLNEIDAALDEIRAQTNLEKFELIGMDACLMGHLEVFEALSPHAHFAVASQETEPSLGWAYTGFLSALASNPSMNGDDLGKLIVQSYISEDQRIVDNQARAEFTRQGSLLGALLGPASGPSADQITRKLSGNITLTAVNLENLPYLTESLNQLAYEMQSGNIQAIGKARTYAQSFTSIFGSDVPPSYIDLGNFVQILADQGGVDDRVSQQVFAALDEVVIAEKHGHKKPGATGISIYFPNPQLYKNSITGAESYTQVAERFAMNTLWDEFLTYYYTGQSFEKTSNVIALPDRSTEIEPPASGGILISSLELSENETSPGYSTLISADISGENIGYIKLFVGFYDRVSNSIYIADTAYLESPETRKVGNLYYPDWGNGEEFRLEFEWEPYIFAISDGTNLVPALFNPERYGAAPEEAVYTVDGIYRDGDDGSERFAKLYFSDGVLQQVFGFNNDGTSAAGAPWEILPQPGDAFTIFERWIDLDSQGNVVSQVTYQESQTLFFGSQPFQWETIDAAAGEYLVGFIVEDLDGQQFPAYKPITVR